MGLHTVTLSAEWGMCSSSLVRRYSRLVGGFRWGCTRNNAMLWTSGGCSINNVLLWYMSVRCTFLSNGPSCL
eukprot:jgi/Botrbrau1/23601/Bobra.0141s0063.1